MTRSFHGVNFRYVLAPSKTPPISGTLPISADAEQIRAEIDLGYSDAVKAIEDARWNDGSNFEV
jgi:hypothetical protein